MAATPPQSAPWQSSASVTVSMMRADASSFNVADWLCATVLYLILAVPLTNIPPSAPTALEYETSLFAR